MQCALFQGGCETYQEVKMIILITGASHTGKTFVSQKLLEKYKYPYLSQDHLKMGLIRSNNTNLSPLSDTEKLTALLWPIVSGMIKTAIENKQNLIVEGCYIPLDYTKYFEKEHLEHIRCYCLVMSENYINNHFSDIKSYSCVIEQRIDQDCSLEEVLRDNRDMLKKAVENNVNYILIDRQYDIEHILKIIDPA